ncbi:unnamed protein product [Eruca vesicaria subsp. sativa]|uniref:Uncharacterized protein n=1 Tax=Eruca vesicaria subsp. sativa TaxID=29727 RepID=A0ABC8M470_ERUVS|nr:unnamed protein product [Eruca vesicaria subsp. sativa]
MANSYTLLADLNAGRCSNTAEVWLLRFWKAWNTSRNSGRSGELMSLDMLLIDENVRIDSLQYVPLRRDVNVCVSMFDRYSHWINVGVEAHILEQVAVTEVLGGGRFFVQSVGDQKLALIQNRLASMFAKEG